MSQSGLWQWFRSDLDEMNHLFRMSLFLFARAGLCLAVATWIVGQWWLVAVSSPLRVGFSVASEGLAIHQGMKYPWAIQILPLGEFVEEESWVYEEPPEEMPFWGLSRVTGFSVLGATYGDYGTSKFLSIRHKLAVTLSALFYLSLKFIYHKRPRNRPCKV